MAMNSERKKCSVPLQLPCGLLGILLPGYFNASGDPHNRRNKLFALPESCLCDEPMSFPENFEQTFLYENFITLLKMTLDPFQLHLASL